MDIIRYLINIIQQQSQQIGFLLNYIRKFLPLGQWVYDDSHSPKYQRYKVDKLPIILPFFKQDWQFLLKYYQFKYEKNIKPVQRHEGNSISDTTVCPVCGAPHLYIYDNNGGNGQFKCKICGHTFWSGLKVSNPVRLICPYCGKMLVATKDRSFFRVHKCINPKCSYYLSNLKKVDKKDIEQKYKYKLHYIYREFPVDFFKMDIRSLPENSSSLKFTKHNAHIMSLCLTLHVNLQLSLRKTAQAMNDLYGIKISHQQIANYARTAALVIKPFVDNYDYKASSTMVADETYIKVRGIKGFVWFVMDALSRSILGYQVSESRSVGPCILAIRKAFRHFEKLPKNFRFIADGYTAYPLAAQQFKLEHGTDFDFSITPVIGLTNEDAVSTEFRPAKQIVERLNRTFKASYRISCGFDNYEGANYNVALWVAYYNFLRPHKHARYQPLNQIDDLEHISTMPGKWQMLILLGQQTIIKMQEAKICS